jgi:hypothetical protein
VVARWQAHLRGLATAIHEISGLELSQPAISISVKRGEKIARDKDFDLLLK